MNIKYSEQDIEFLRANYASLGPKKCAEILGFSLSGIHHKAWTLGIKHYTPPDMDIRPSKELAYFMGYLWADGHLRKRVGKTGKIHYALSMTILQDDFADIQHIFSAVGLLKVWHRPDKGRRRAVTCMYATNQEFNELLYKLGFANKSSGSPRQIQKFLGAFYPYFIRGWFDGDGCICIGKRSNYLNWSGSFSQDWHCLEKLGKMLKITYHIYRVKKYNGKVSVFHVSRIADIIKLGEYMHLGSFGLKRKMDKFLGFAEARRGER